MVTEFDMNQWGYIKDKLRYEYPELTDADFAWGRVSDDDMIEMISSKLGKTKKNLMDTIESF